LTESSRPRVVKISCTHVQIAPDFFGYFRDVFHSTFDNDLAALEKILLSGVEGKLKIIFVDYHSASEDSKLVLQSVIHIIDKVNARTNDLEIELL
jgi:RNAse (barnase) inhibitor barstar